MRSMQVCWWPNSAESRFGARPAPADSQDRLAARWKSGRASGHFQVLLQLDSALRIALQTLRSRPRTATPTLGRPPCPGPAGMSHQTFVGAPTSSVQQRHSGRFTPPWLIVSSLCEKLGCGIAIVYILGSRNNLRDEFGCRQVHLKGRQQLKNLVCSSAKELLRHLQAWH